MGSTTCENPGIIEYSTCSAANAGVAWSYACCDADGTNCNQARVINQPCTTGEYSCKILNCTDPTPAPDDSGEDDTFPVYGIVLIAVFGGLVVFGVIYYVIGKYAVKKNSKEGRQDNPALGQTLIF